MCGGDNKSCLPTLSSSLEEGKEEDKEEEKDKEYQKDVKKSRKRSKKGRLRRKGMVRKRRKRKRRKKNLWLTSRTVSLSERSGDQESSLSITFTSLKIKKERS